MKVREPGLIPSLCPQDCTDPCCDYFTCQLRPGAQCASQGPCCENCQVGRREEKVGGHQPCMGHLASVPSTIRCVPPIPKHTPNLSGGHLGYLGFVLAARDWEARVALTPQAWLALTLLFTQLLQLRAAGGQCRPARGECDLPEFCTGDSAQCPPDLGLGDGEPCANGAAVCMHGLCASYVQQCQGLWGPGAQPALPLCLQTANAQGNAFGSCGRHPNGSYMACAPRCVVGPGCS